MEDIQGNRRGAEIAETDAEKMLISDFCENGLLYFIRNLHGQDARVTIMRFDPSKKPSP